MAYSDKSGEEPGERTLGKPANFTRDQVIETLDREGFYCRGGASFFAKGVDYDCTVGYFRQPDKIDLVVDMVDTFEPQKRDALRFEGVCRQYGFPATRRNNQNDFIDSI